MNLAISGLSSAQP